MAIPESDVAILVPAFGRKDQTIDAICTALSSCAGEIVVSLDTDPDRMARDLEIYHDSRLRVVVQSRRLGLWPNHLVLLRDTRHPFVKFLQTDDRLLPGGLRTLCEAVDSDTTVVSGLPYYENLDTRAAWRLRTLTEPGRWMSTDYLRRAEVTGNELGRPSYTLFRREAIPLDEEIWQDDVSADWAMNLVAASRGGIALVPHGTIVCGVHGGQDGVTQGPQLTTRRLVNTLEVLHDRFGAALRKVVSYQAAAAVVTIARNAVGFVRRGRSPLYGGLAEDMLRLLRLVDRPTLQTRYGLSRAMEAVAFRYAVERQSVKLFRQGPEQCE